VENRKLMKEMGIEGMGKPLGRPPKELTTGEYQVLKGLLCILFWDAGINSKPRQLLEKVSANAEIYQLSNFARLIYSGNPI
jgi:hypothetical protein